MISSHFKKLKYSTITNLISDYYIFQPSQYITAKYLKLTINN